MEKYETPEMEVIRFEAEDIITTSNNELAIAWYVEGEGTE